MKKFKKLLSVVVAAMICLSITVPSQAAELNGTISSLMTIMDGVNIATDDTEGSLKIQFSGTPVDKMFSAHKLLDIANNSGDLTVKIPSGKAQEFWNAYTGKTVATISDIKTTLNGWGPDSATQSNSVVQKFLELGDDKKPDGIESSVVDGKAQIVTAFGLYVIQQIKAPDDGCIASAPILACLPMQETEGTQWLKSFTVKPKDDTVNIDKKVFDAKSVAYKDETITNIGDTVKYEITADLPMYGADVTNITYTITDKLKPGITGVSNIKVLLKKRVKLIFRKHQLPI